MIAILKEEGREITGPVKRDGAIVYEEIDSAGDLPMGWVDEQSGGRYRLKKEGNSYFSATLGPSSWKRILHPPRQTMWRTEVKDGTTEIIPEPHDETLRAFIGVRACDLAAIAIQDKVFLDGPYKDPHYQARRDRTFLVAVNCTRAADTCFCVSMGTGPRATKGYDIALTELSGGRFLAEAGSKAGAEKLNALTSEPAIASDLKAAEKSVAGAERQSRHIDRDGLPEVIKANSDHPHWEDIASRCLNCANCTMVCPTCFCTTMEELNSLDGQSSERVSRWAWCFTTDFSHVHGGSVRGSTKARYRQWMSHKLSNWVEQFDTMGCVGCGRCITWCPVGIDITAEAAAIREGRE
ncbi:MAG: 4Fe-4S dicluster domain-containing protein [Maritimibacter sp.]